MPDGLIALYFSTAPPGWHARCGQPGFLRSKLKNRIPFLAAVLWLLLAALAGAQSLGDFLGPGVNLADPTQRADVVAKMQAIEKTKHDAALKLAAQRGLPRRIVLRNGTVRELVTVERGRPVYFTTHNANAAISTGANLLQAAPYSVSGSGFTVGEWDGGSARTTHQEFGRAHHQQKQREFCRSLDARGRHHRGERRAGARRRAWPRRCGWIPTTGPTTRAR